MTITITLGRSNVIDDMRVKSHFEAAAISDAEERYIVEAGSEKASELNQSVTDAFAEVSSIVRQFITGEATASANDSYRAAGDLVLVLEVPARKSTALAVPLADALHKYAVDSALVKFYHAVSRPNFGDMHERELVTDKANIDILLFTKQEPTY